MTEVEALAPQVQGKKNGEPVLLLRFPIFFYCVGKPSFLHNKNIELMNVPAFRQPFEKPHTKTKVALATFVFIP